MKFTIETEHEEDGRWIAEVLELPGVMVYGSTEQEAISKAQALGLRVITDRSEHGEEVAAERVIENLLTKLKELKPAILARFKAKEIGVFGSFVRGEQSATSDVDLLVEFEDDADLFDLMGLAVYLEEVLKRKVDVVSKRALRIELRESVLREVVAIRGRNRLMKRYPQDRDTTS